MIDSFNLGVAAEFLAASILIEQGWDVYLPFDRRGKVDLLIRKDGKVLTVQVKRARWAPHSNTPNEYLRAVCSSHGVKYNPKEVDVFVFVDEDHRAWMIPVSELQQSTILLDKRMKGRGWKTKQSFDAERYLITSS